MMNQGVLERRLRELEDTVARISAHVASVSARPADVPTGVSVRIARTYDNGSYPGTGDTFPATFVDATFTEAGGTQTPSVTERNTANVVFIHNTHSSYIPVNTLVPVTYVNGRWWTWKDSGTGQDADGVVRIKNYTGSPATCDTQSRDGSSCLYSGKILTLAGSPNFCSDPWTEGSDCWIADIDRCSPPTSLNFNDAYIGRKLSDSYRPTIGDPYRPLYVIRNTDSSGSSVSIIKVTATSGSSCASASPVSVSECIYTAKLQSVAVGGADMCAPFSDGADVFAFVIGGCSDVTVKKDERYLALKVGSFTSAAAGATRDIYAIIGSYAAIVYPQLAYANGTISANGSGSVYLAHDNGSGVLSTTQSATSLAVKNPFNGDIIDDTLVMVQQAQTEMTGTASWVIAPMHLEYRGKANGDINASSSGTVDIWKSTFTGVSVTAHHDWITGGIKISSGKQVIIAWCQSEMKWRIIEAECE